MRKNPIACQYIHWSLIYCKKIRKSIYFICISVLYTRRFKLVWLITQWNRNRWEKYFKFMKKIKDKKSHATVPLNCMRMIWRSEMFLNLVSHFDIDVKSPPHFLLALNIFFMPYTVPHIFSVSKIIYSRYRIESTLYL